MHTRPDPSTVRIDGPWQHRDVHANGIRLHVTETGEGPLVLLLHGFGEFWWTWRHQLTALSGAGFRAVAVDLRGYGDSDKPPRGYDAWTLAGDVGGLVKALGEPKAHLVGHGWGGLLAWTVAAFHPRLVRSVSAFSAPHPLALSREIRRTMLRRKATNQARALGHLFRAQIPLAPERWLTRDDAATVETLLRTWSGPEWTVQPGFDDVARRLRSAMLVRGAAHSALEYYRWAVRSQLRGEGRRYREAMQRRITVPVLQVSGALDPCILPATIRASANWAHGRTETHLLDEVGHFPHQEASTATNRLLADFLARS
ncbi:alpha/beta hydrolase [Actinophytocola xinjiangensis]|uniref:Alpha/beta hydrolase n=1 Tax=Actinophytocola xinjiangensis TaxID=485602 RepID=A0A7Z1AX40_9PSEU|nr:alpha/beta hydrolase [Actinophytocola xinjiangensis]OLF07736.1 alpha/beta hydrolase [Actinophytocola xinjiangensis]